MKKALITLSVISVIAIIVLIIYLVIKRKQASKSGDGTENGTNGSEDSAFPLKYSLFSRSDKVAELQSKLNAKLEASVEPNFPKDSNGVYIKSLKEDGYFGDKTLAAVKYFCDGKEEVTKEMFDAL